MFRSVRTAAVLAATALVMVLGTSAPATTSAAPSGGQQVSKISGEPWCC